MRNFFHNLLLNLKERSLKQRLILILPVLLVLVLILWFLHDNHQSSTTFRTVPVTRGDLLATISATGTVEPEEVVDIGAQVAGKIVSFGKDKDGKTVDYGSRVEAGTVLAKIDDALYAADVSQTKAALAQAKANVQRAEADLGQLKAKLYQAERDWMRAQKLGPSDALSQSDYDAALSAFEVAKANLNVGKAAVIQAKDAVGQAAATLRRASQNLEYCTIKSPVKGVIIDRRVNIGQTVVASLNAPSLFLLAKDLKRLQVWASVNEADIGNIHPGQPVNFTVDAYPGITFQGEVSKVRLNATMTQNVVTYTVEVSTDNSDGKLIPYLTANLRFLVAEKKNVLLAPNAALRWTPLPNQIDPEFRGAFKKKEGRKPGSQKTASKKKREQAAGTLWVLHSDYVRPLKVRRGPTDGSMTVVEAPGLKEGIQVVVGERQQNNGNEGADSSSPFTPQFFRKK
ncbi:MAG: efflux RND transporter periplasmic adaptor subunit [Syntrophales bacterium]|nr:efflux RND transporter periplasmic adaptor subunit [Syntrophales bacterium]MDD5642248.1 efflux RND transporter periplasmic adaptor subunit [Syntrophales bacterium]